MLKSWESVMYTMVCTRLDIAHDICTLSKFMANLDLEH